MANSKLFKKKKYGNDVLSGRVPAGIDPKIYHGVRVGMNAMKTRQIGLINKGSKTVCVSPDRHDQRLLSLGRVLDDAQANAATVALNGSLCVEGRDYSISGSVLNWVSDRKLYSSDVIAVRYPLIAGVTGTAVAPTGVLSATAVTLQEVNKIVTALAEKVAVRTAELEVAVESLDTDLQAATFAAKAEIEELEELEVVETPIEEEEDMIEAGVKVYHRLSDDGPWIVVQPTVLNIKSREEGGAENAFKAGFVELAWTVQTQDGVRDFPEVVLTTRVPKKERFWTWKKVTGAVIGASVLVGSIVHAPLILSMLGIIH